MLMVGLTLKVLFHPLVLCIVSKQLYVSMFFIQVCFNDIHIILYQYIKHLFQCFVWLVTD